MSVRARARNRTNHRIAKLGTISIGALPENFCQSLHIAETGILFAVAERHFEPGQQFKFEGIVRVSGKMQSKCIIYESGGIDPAASATTILLARIVPFAASMIEQCQQILSRATNRYVQPTVHCPWFHCRRRDRRRALRAIRTERVTQYACRLRPSPRAGIPQRI
ncbi:hypothetical protein LLG95_11905 [bacterium]|nr:hypothetical protein [bacterium]